MYAYYGEAKFHLPEHPTNINVIVTTAATTGAIINHLKQKTKQKKNKKLIIDYLKLHGKII